jgi:triacylglycerol lipase
MRQAPFALAVVAALAWSAVQAQPPADVAARLHAIGPKIEVAETSRLYAALTPKDLYQGVYPTRDLAYGPDDKQKLDVFTAAPSGAPKPVLVFVHGGGFVGGDKHAGGILYDNVMAWAARNGLVGVDINYRLAPKAVWPAGAQDVSAAAKWIRQNIGRYGGDPRRIYLWGHSVGAVHVADYLAGAADAKGSGGVAGAILTSGQIYDMTGPNVSKAYHGADLAAYPAMASLPRLLRTHARLMITRAELDPPAFRTQSETLIQALRGARRSPVVLELKDHSHISEMLAIGTPDSSLSGPVLAFVRGRPR